MPEQRLKGQEVEIMLIVGGEAKTTITAIKNFEVSGMLEILREGYLGETTDRRDEIYRGVKGRMEVHFENSEMLLLARSIADRARRRVPGSRINVKATLNFPNGERPIIVVPNAFFGEFPMNAGDRASYVGTSVDFEAEDYRLLNI